MTRLPRHRVSDISETGIHLRVFSPDNIRETPVNYAHQDDYYIFGFIESGTCNIRIDFDDYELAANKTALILPGQVHCFTHSAQLSAYLLMIDSAFVEETSQRAFEQYTLTSQLICLSPQQQTKLKSLFAILSDNQSLPGNRSQALNLHVSLAIIDIIEDAVISQQTSNSLPQRYVEHTIIFRNLLKQHNTRYRTNHSRRRTWNRTAGCPILDRIAYLTWNFVFHSFSPAHQSALEMVQKPGQKN